MILLYNGTSVHETAKWLMAETTLSSGVRVQAAMAYKLKPNWPPGSVCHIFVTKTNSMLAVTVIGIQCCQAEVEKQFW